MLVVPFMSPALRQPSPVHRLGVAWRGDVQRRYARCPRSLLAPRVASEQLLPLGCAELVLGVDD